MRAKFVSSAPDSWRTHEHDLYGDNIFEIGARCGRVLKAAGWERTKIDAVHKEASEGDYAKAVAVYGRFITIKRD